MQIGSETSPEDAGKFYFIAEKDEPVDEDAPEK